MNKKIEKILAIVLVVVMALGSVAAAVEAGAESAEEPSEPAPIADPETALETIPEAASVKEEASEVPAWQRLFELRNDDRAFAEKLNYLLAGAEVNADKVTDLRSICDVDRFFEEFKIVLNVLVGDKTEEVKALLSIVSDDEFRMSFAALAGINLSETAVPETPEVPSSQKNGEQKEETPELSESEEIYNKLMEAKTIEEFDATQAVLTEEQLAAATEFLQQNPDKAEALQAHLNEIDPPVEYIPVTVPFTQAGPFMPPVTVQMVMTAKSGMAKAPAENDNGIELGKTAVKNFDGTYTITLESYTTGNVKTETTAVPMDVVLVIDQSGSMSEGFSGAASRQAAMKNAVNGFIDAVAGKYDAANNADHRMVIVTFGSELLSGGSWTAVDNKGKDLLQQQINNLKDPWNQATNIAAGMQQAEYLMGNGYNYTGNNIKRQKVVIVFTDGAPTTDSNFSIDVANSAIQSAKKLKDSGIAVYSVGIFPGTNVTQTYGETGFMENSDGTVGSKWCSETKGILEDYPDEVDIPASNRFLNYLSNNYLYATSLGLEKYHQSRFFANDYMGYKIITNFSGSNLGYYLSASNSDELNNIFQTISDQIATPTVDLGSEAVVKDVITPYFNVPNAENIEVFTADYNGKSFENEKKSDLKATVNGDTISVTGFDYTANFVSENPKADGSYGKKLIIKFTVSPRDGFWGGNSVPTNGETSGLYAKPDENHALENFVVPAVDVELNVPELKPVDKNIYLLGTAPTAKELCNSDAFKMSEGENIWQTEFIRIIGAEGSTVSNIKDGEYKVTIEVKPTTAGSVKASSQTVTSKVNVYTPELTFRDSEIFLGDTPDYAQNGGNNVVWYHGAEKLTDKSIMSGAEPELDISYSPVAGKFDTDTDVSVTVKIGENDVTEFTAIKNSTTGKMQGTENTETTDNHAFTVVVKGGTLTITKGGSVGANEGFIFTVSGPDGFARTVTVKGNGSVKLTNLPAGTYTVTEDTSWSWKYTSDGEKSAAISEAQPNASVTVVNTVKGTGPIGGEAYVKNTTVQTSTVVG